LREKGYLKWVYLCIWMNKSLNQLPRGYVNGV
jgi:hypothetical protein